MKETEVVREIIRAIRYAGVWCQKIQSGEFYVRPAWNSKITYKITCADPGTPDVIACAKGVFIGFEVKKDQKAIRTWQKKRNQSSIDQHNQHDLIREAGGKVITIASPEEAVAYLKSLNLISA